MKLSNKIVLVTGGTSGIGLEAAKLFPASQKRQPQHCDKACKGADEIDGNPKK